MVVLDGIEIYADLLLENVFFEMVKNVIEHGGGADAISLKYTRESDGVTILFEDNGPGIPAADKERIFHEEHSKNMGSGLFLAREVLAITGISLRETGEEGGGARFEIFVPEGTFRFPGKDKP